MLQHYVDDKIWGPDVSKWRLVSDWGALAASGATFFGAKATEGVRTVDPTFAENLEGFRSRPEFVMGVWYCFLHCEKSPADQAELLARTVGGLQPRERLCLDFEGKSYLTIEPKIMSMHGLDYLEEFYARLDTLGILGGSRPLIYTSARHWDAIGNPSWARADQVDLWVPRYHKPPLEPVRLPSPWKKWTVFQWTDGDQGERFQVPGIGLCDVNVVSDGCM